MKSLMSSIAALSLIAASAPAAAEPAHEAAASSSSSSASDGGAATAKAEKKICRRYDATADRTESVRLCLTREQWKKFEAQQD
ncbi:MAG: hypothetical protein ACJ8EB_09105 [Allosphingosinicella sp.]